MNALPDRLIPQPAVAFPRPIVVDDVPLEGLAIAVEAKPDECVAVAEDLGLPRVATLRAEYRLSPRPGGRLQVSGQLASQIVQVCVVSLEAFESEIVQPIEVIFAPAPKPSVEEPRASRREDRHRPAATREPAPPPPPADGEADPPDLIVDGRIDLGALAVEFLALGLDFYPRKPGVHFTDVVIGDTGRPEPSAFAALERLKDRS